MLVRHVVVPTSPDHLWDVLTQPERLENWFGARIEWDLRPGGLARFVDDDGTIRLGVVESVERGRRLQFRWWPEGDRQGATSEVSYDLEADGDGTRLTVTEQRVSKETPTGDHSARAHASMTATGAATWSDWDSRLFGCWAGVAAVGLVGSRVG
jgi:uncharacterized protein YndB with AHSA1/START domain